jgi:hypothetical protein
MRLSLRQAKDRPNETWRDIYLNNIHARHICTSGHRAEFASGWDGQMRHNAHNRAAFFCYVRGKNSIIDNLHYDNCSVISSSSFGFALHSEGTSSYSGSCYNIYYNNCLAQGIGMLDTSGSAGKMGNYSVAFSPNEKTKLSKNIFYNNCIARNVYRSGFHQEAVPLTQNVNYINCLVEDIGRHRNYEYAKVDLTDAQTYAKGFWLYSGTTCINCKSINQIFIFCQKTLRKIQNFKNICVKFSRSKFN